MMAPQAEQLRAARTSISDGIFVGRFHEMWKIHSALHKTRVAQITRAGGQDIAQVTGLGGIGNPQKAMSCMTSAYLGSPRGLVSRCKTYER